MPYEELPASGVDNLIDWVSKTARKQVFALVAQWIEHWFAESEISVRF